MTVVLALCVGMLALAAHPLGVHTRVLEPSERRFDVGRLWKIVSLTGILLACDVQRVEHPRLAEPAPAADQRHGKQQRCEGDQAP